MSPLSSRLIWIDNSLSPLVARALRAVGYNAVAQDDIPEFKGQTSVTDPEIIAWLGPRDGIWVHKDNDSRTRHARQILTERVNTIWLAEPEEADFSSAGQLRLVSYALPEILRHWEEDEPTWQHFEIRPRGERISVRGFVLSP